MNQKIVALLVVFAGVPTMGFAAQLPESAASAEAGKALYVRYCSTCHGMDGKGDGSAAVYLNPKPRDFTRGIFKFQSTPSGSLPTDADLHRTLKNGMPGSAMPAWDRLSDQQRSDLIAYLKILSERFTTEKPTDILTIDTEPVQTPEMVKSGKAVYALSGCWNCHGKTGAGDGPSAEALADDFGRSIKPYNFTRAGAFKGGGTPKDIYRTFSTGIGGTPMPGYGEDALTIGRESASDLTALEGQYTPEEIQEIKTYVSTWPTDAVLSQMSVA
ncbi:MAG: c-type cytochrome, partial [Bacteroidota bacterium]